MLRERWSGHIARISRAAAETPAAPPLRLSKLKVRRALRSLEMEHLLDAFLAGDPQAAADWDDSQVILTDDPLLVAALPAFASATGMAETRIRALLETCQEN